MQKAVDILLFILSSLVLLHGVAPDMSNKSGGYFLSFSYSLSVVRESSVNTGFKTDGLAGDSVVYTFPALCPFPVAKICFFSLCCGKFGLNPTRRVGLVLICVDNDVVYCPDTELSTESGVESVRLKLSREKY